MKYDEIREAKRRIEFDLTEPETLVNLVQDARLKGEKVRNDLSDLKRIAGDLRSFIESRGLLFKGESLRDIKIPTKRGVGIDGSFQLVGGAGGKWFAPISVARISFEDGPMSSPKVDIFGASIYEIDETEDPKPNNVASVIMLSAEVKAIFDWGTQPKAAIVMIDGPIVDPPVFSYGGQEYVSERCEAIRKCVKKDLFFGCVKRSRDSFFIENLTKSEPSISGRLTRFPSDQYLVAYLFADLRDSGFAGALFTDWVDASPTSSLYKAYSECGVYVVCFFVQREVNSQVLRVDIPLEFSPEKDSARVDLITRQAARSVVDWTFPGQDYPLPIFLAHGKCNIREGCAEVLYNEIMTRGMTTDPRNQAIMSQLR